MNTADTTPPPFHVVPLLDGTCAVEHLLDFTAADSVESGLRALCMTIQANAAWKRMEGLRLVARPAPSPLLAVFAPDVPGHTGQLITLRETLEEILPRHTFVEYGDAEAAALGLADILIARFGNKEIHSWNFAAMPRGGIVVMGLLAYILDLKPDQIFIAGTRNIPKNDRTICIVDDCALSGIRFRETLRAMHRSDAGNAPPEPLQAGGGIVFCPFFAPTDLCRSIEDNEPAVQACITAHPLEDLAPARFVNRYPEWYAERSRMFTDAYWIGIPEYVSFAWHEPDSRAWNQETGEIEDGWYLAPANRCLSNRLRIRRAELNGVEELETLSKTTPDLIHGGNGSIRAADGVVWCPSDQGLQLARITPRSEGRPGAVDYFELSGSAVSMWYGIIRHGNVDGCVDEILSQYQGDRETVCHDVENLLTELSEFGLLEFRSSDSADRCCESFPEEQIEDPMHEGNVS